MWDKLKGQFNLLKLEKKKLCLITNSDKFVSKNDFIDAVASALQGGVDIILLNEKNIPDGVIVDIGRKIRVLCDEYGATFIVKGRADIAMLAEADGVHLEQNGLTISDARDILPYNAIVGKSVHNSDEVQNAIKQEADYLILSQVMPQKEPFNPDLFLWAKEAANIPVFLFGDFNIDEIAQHGIDKIAVGEELMYARIPELKAREFLKRL